jgi:hypothetical protein
MAKEYWLKALGMGARGQQMPDDWRSITVLTHSATFAREPSLKAGDGIVYYASGKGLIFAAGEVTSYPYRAEDPSESNWPWRVNVRLDHQKEWIHEGAALETLNVGDRDIRVSMRRRSHIRLTEDEYNAAVAALQ